jgi:hypothetical protein
MTSRPLIVTGQQIGAGWSPALAVAKALTALSEAQRVSGDAVYWLADEDHDRAEVASVVGRREGRWHRHRFSFQASPGTATGWLPWSAEHQAQAEGLWGTLPTPTEPSLRGHVLALGQPLWARGLKPFSPTDPAVREPIQAELERWRSLHLEALLIQQATVLEAEGAPVPLDPRTQSAWFSLHPRTGQRRRLASNEPLPTGHWLSPGAALRPLMQSLLLPVTAAVLGPSERAYWRLCEPLWDKVELSRPRIIPRPSIFVLPSGIQLAPEHLDVVRDGRWEALSTWNGELPSHRGPLPEPDKHWPEAVQARFRLEMERTKSRLSKLDHRLHRDSAAVTLGMDPEQLRQALFPFGLPQERVVSGVPWLRNARLLDQLLKRMDGNTPLILLEEP